MTLIDYRLYITYTLTDYFFNLKQSNIYRNVQKIECLIIQWLPLIPQIYKITEVKNIRGSKDYFLEFSIHDATK